MPKDTLPRSLIFGVAGNGVTIHARGHKLLGRAGTVDGMKALIERIKLTDNDIVMFSSSMDFPKEYTKNKKVLALVKKLQTRQLE